jgi:hypothetical protein
MLAAWLSMCASQCLFGADSAGALKSGLSRASQALVANQSVTYQRNVAPLLKKYCLECHGETKPKGDVVLAFKDENEVKAKASANLEFWSKVTDMVSSQDMPPRRATKKPTDKGRALLLSSINLDLLEPLAAKRGPTQVAKVRRLTKVEYANTVCDLFYFTDFKTDDLPPDELGYGFDNIADLLTISPNHLDLYLKTAEQVIAQLESYLSEQHAHLQSLAFVDGPHGRGGEKPRRQHRTPRRTHSLRTA